MKAYQQRLGVASKILPLESFLSEDKDITVHPHWHTEIEILYVLEGCAMQQIANQYFPIFAGDIVFIGSNYLHSTYSVGNEACRIRVLQFLTKSLLPASTPEGVRQLKRFDKLLFTHAIPARDERFLLRNLETLFMNENNELAIRSALYAFANEILNRFPNLTGAPEKEHSLNMLKNTFSYIDRNYQNPISLADAAAQSSLSVTHFSRLFKQATGMTFKEYLNLYRVNMAQHALMGDDSITKIALDYGFGTIGSFTRNYKKYKKTLPSAMRKERS